jgi:gamma-butyrobetaine dioxygenase
MQQVTIMESSKVSFEENPPSVKLYKDDTAFEIPALWLREKTQDPAATDTLTQQRLFDSHLIDPDIELSSVESMSTNAAWLSFTDGHRALYQSDLILNEIQGTNSYPEPVSWDCELNQDLIRHDWRQMTNDYAFSEALTAYLKYGFIILSNVPNTPEQVLDVGAKFGYVKETNFGKYFEVYSKPEANDLAYRSVRLGPHTDNPYRDPVPGIQLLHCLVNETTGGLSTLVDSIKVVDTLMSEDLSGYIMLKNTPVRFRFVDKGIELTTQRAMIHTDETGKTLGVHYSPRLDSLPLLSASNAKAFHKARKRLAELFNHHDYELKFKLLAGELMLFDNSRVLHGRTSYDPTEGHRHLQGCYIDLDGPRERFSAITKRLRVNQETY